MWSVLDKCITKLEVAEAKAAEKAAAADRKAAERAAAKEAERLAKEAEREKERKERKEAAKKLLPMQVKIQMGKGLKLGRGQYPNRVLTAPLSA